MEIVPGWVAGLDVHKATIVACVRLGTGRKVTRECRTFDTTTDGLVALLRWLVECRCSDVAMEATGVYWMPVWKILSDGDFVLIVANAAHIKNVPGRKTDLNDAMWIADLLACGLIKSSFVPEEDNAGTTFVAAHPQATGARSDPECPADPEDARGGQRQAGLGALRHHGRQRAADNRGDDGRRTRSAPIGGVGQHPDQGDAEAVVRCAARTADRSSPLPAEASSATVGWIGCDDRGDRSGRRGTDRGHRQGGQDRRGPVSRTDRAFVHDRG